MDTPSEFLTSPSSPEEPAIVPARKTGGVFTGRFGLRAGWGILLYVLVITLCITAFTLISKKVKGRGDTQHNTAAMTGQTAREKGGPEAEQARVSKGPAYPGRTIFNEGALAAAIFAGSLALRRIERRRLAVYGIGKYRVRDLVPGAIFGIFTLSILVVVMWLCHALAFENRALSGVAIFVWGAKWLLAFFLVGIFEEYFFRGYLQYTLTRGLFGLGERISPTRARAIAFWIAAVLTSAFFFAAHGSNPGETLPGLIAVALAGLTFSYALWRTGSLWWAIGFHATWDWGQSFLYGVPDSGYISFGRLFVTHPAGNRLLSGGTAGPEGSVFVIPTLLLVVLVLRFTQPGVQPTLEPNSRHTALPHDTHAAIS